MFRYARRLIAAALLLMVTVSGCASIRQMSALRNVRFAFASVSDVRFAGVPIGPGTNFSQLGLTDLARVSAALVAKRAPLELVAHVNATNPEENLVAARMLELGWKFYGQDQETLAGRIGEPVVIERGQTVDVPVAVGIDLMKVKSGTARELFDLAVAIAGNGPIRQDLKLELTPTIDTAIGPITYPSPIVIRRPASQN